MDQLKIYFKKVYFVEKMLHKKHVSGFKSAHSYIVSSIPVK